MSIAKLYSRALFGMYAPQVVVEVHVANGLPSFTLVGLPDTEVRESRDRVRSAIQISGFNFPARRITVNLAPAALPKESARYDLPIALGILLAAKLIHSKLELSTLEFAGELALDGELRAINGALALAQGVNQSLRQFILPRANAVEASLIETLIIRGADSLNQVINHITQTRELRTQQLADLTLNLPQTALDFSQIKGQLVGKKACEIAAAGGHSLLLKGNPGCGKSMLAERISTILPSLSEAQALESAALYSLSSQGFNLSNWRAPPWRAPHHSSTVAALLGGGVPPRPGEISLAHNGILFLDELPEFARKVLESLREPLESGKIRLTRAHYQVEYLAAFQLVAAMNPCPCGNLGHPQQSCICSNTQINRYLGHISAPLYDRIDMIVVLPLLKPQELQELDSGETSSQIKARVLKARELQYLRQGKLNSTLSNTEVEQQVKLTKSTSQLLQQIIIKHGLSARAYYRMLKLSRTLADLEQCPTLKCCHIALASHYKNNFNL
jgi:magnesium chelatase family protein